MTDPRRPAPARLLWLVFWTSAGVLGFEIALMRLLLIASWHHFAFLIISIALIGFGASGTLLTIVRGPLLRRADRSLFLIGVLAAASMLISISFSQHIPTESRFVPALLGIQVSRWCLFWLVLIVPFLLGAAVIGLGLMSAGRQLPGVYAANLVGSGVGALLISVVMAVAPPHWVAAAMAIPVLVGVALVGRMSPWFRAAGLIGLSVVALLVITLSPPGVRLDEFKYGAHLQRLEEQGSVERVALACSPRARVECYRGTVLHDLPFLSVGDIPPPISVMTLDGHWAGSVLETADDKGASAGALMDRTLPALAYELAHTHPRVALLGEVGGTNVWLAHRYDASKIDIIQPNRAVTALLRGPLIELGGAFLDLPSVSTIHAEPRHHIERTNDTYDLMHLVGLDSAAASSGGVGGIGQEILLTIEGIDACLDRLSDGGLLVVCRGIQTPPRENIKLLATFVEALRRRGVADPGRYILIARDYLAVSTIVKTSPWSAAEIDRARTALRRRGLTPVWYHDVHPSLLNQPDALPPAPDGPGDWFHFSARQLLSDDAASFIADYRFDIRPPTDDRPFFFDLCRVGSIGALREAYGVLWLTRADIAYLFVVVAAGLISIVGAGLILLPLPWLGHVRLAGSRMAIVLSFASIGLGYMLMEVTWLSRLTQMIGDPVLAAAVTIAGFLFCSGLGAMVVQHGAVRAKLQVIPIFAALIVMAITMSMALDPLTSFTVSWSTGARVGCALTAIAPMAFLMGIPMPLGLARLERSSPVAIPWAWAVNGFASVLATPLALILGMTWGFSVASMTAVVFYVLAAVAFRLLPR